MYVSASTHISSSVHGGQTVFEDNHFFLKRTMAILFYADHTSAKFTHAEPVIDDFMRRAWTEDACAEWLEIEMHHMKSDDTPWKHPCLRSTMEQNEQPDDEHYQTQFWSYRTMAMYKSWTPPFLEGHSIHKATQNTWCPNVKGDILVYRVCICDYDGSNYKCEDDMDVERILKLLNDTVTKHNGFIPHRHVCSVTEAA